MLYSTNSFILRKRNLSEKDQIITVFSRDKGKLDLVSKASKSVLSKKASKLELMNEVRLTIVKGKNLDILTECRLIDSWKEIKFQNKHGNYLFILAEMLVSSETDIDEISQVYDSTEELLNFLNEKDLPIEKLEFYISFWVINYLRILGFSDDYEEIRSDDLENRVIKYLSDKEFSLKVKLDYSKIQTKELLTKSVNLFEKVIDKKLRCMELI